VTTGANTSLLLDQSHTSDDHCYDGVDVVGYKNANIEVNEGEICVLMAYQVQKNPTLLRASIGLE